MKADFRHKPEWLKIRLPRGFKAEQVVGLLNDHHIHTICSSGMCPNRGECWSRGTATFMIGGGICTRNCKFCNVTSGRPQPLDPSEIEHIIESVKRLELKHVVLTSVDRDDLPDGGAGHWSCLIKGLHEHCPHTTMETLIPDFMGRKELLDMVIEAAPDIISHNMETVRRLTPQVRSVATYDRSLEVLRYISDSGIRTKSGIMLGLGETMDEIYEVMDDLLQVGVQVITIGQYLQPTRHNWPVREYIEPEIFERLGQEALARGFRHAESAPMVRSSYHAEKHIL